MSKIVTAVFDGQVLRFEAPLDLEPNIRYRITIEPEPGDPAADETTLAALFLAGSPAQPNPDAWESIIEAFGKHPDLAEWWAEGRHIRESERSEE